MKNPEYRMWSIDGEDLWKASKKKVNRLAKRAALFQVLTLDQLREHAPDAPLTAKMARCSNPADDTGHGCESCSDACVLGGRCHIGEGFMSHLDHHPPTWSSAGMVLSHPDDCIDQGNLHRLGVEPTLARMRHMARPLARAFGKAEIAGIVAPELLVEVGAPATWQLAMHVIISFPDHPDRERLSETLASYGFPKSIRHIGHLEHPSSFWDWECIAPVPYGVQVSYSAERNGESMRRATMLEGAAAAEYTLWLDAFPESSRLIRISI